MGVLLVVLMVIKDVLRVPLVLLFDVLVVSDVVQQVCNWKCSRDPRTF